MFPELIKAEARDAKADSYRDLVVTFSLPHTCIVHIHRE